MKGDWDILPHGLGKKGDLEDASVLEGKNVGQDLGAFKTENIGENLSTFEGGHVGGALATAEAENVGSGLRRSKRKSVGGDLSAFKDAIVSDNVALSNKKTVNTKASDVKTEEPEVKTKRKIATPSVPKVKAHRYGLTPGRSPYPDLNRPTIAECYEVHQLLTDLHGEVKAPKKIPPPSTSVTGCGEVPDILDALLRTLLSAATTMKNADKALQGLEATFGLATKGAHKGSINWEAVRLRDLQTLIDSIKSGGLATTKGKNIKKILDIVYERNSSRLEALLDEIELGKVPHVVGAKHETRHQKDTEIMRLQGNPLSLDYLFELNSNEVMDELTKLPSIGVKTSSCVMLFCMKRPSFAVDTHVFRHCKWLGWVPEKANRDKTFSHLEVKVPNDLKYGLHQLFIKHGKTCVRCRANTGPGSEGWSTANCPIEHLVKRTGLMKEKVHSPVKKSKAKKVEEIESDEEIESMDEDEGIEDE